MANCIYSFIVCLISAMALSSKEKEERDKEFYLSSIGEFVQGDNIMFTFGYTPYIGGKDVSFFNGHKVHFADGSWSKLSDLSAKELKCLHKAIKENYEFIKNSI